MSKSIYRWQVELKSGDTVRTCYVDKLVKLGNQITLKDSEEPKRLWTVTWIGEMVHKTHLNTDGWKVGGLS